MWCHYQEHGQSHVGETRYLFRVLLGIFLVKLVFGLSEIRLEGKVDMDVREVGCENGSWMELAWVCV